MDAEKSLIPVKLNFVRDEAGSEENPKAFAPIFI